eukprot:scaffold21406_cov20-Tisochrysis_lutea.AAC.1
MHLREAICIRFTQNRVNTCWYCELCMFRACCRLVLSKERMSLHASSINWDCQVATRPEAEPGEGEAVRKQHRRGTNSAVHVPWEQMGCACAGNRRVHAFAYSAKAPSLQVDCACAVGIC